MHHCKALLSPARPGDPLGSNSSRRCRVGRRRANNSCSLRRLQIEQIERARALSLSHTPLNCRANLVRAGCSAQCALRQLCNGQPLASGRRAGRRAFQAICARAGRRRSQSPTCRQRTSAGRPPACGRDISAERQAASALTSSAARQTGGPFALRLGHFATGQLAFALAGQLSQ